VSELSPEVEAPTSWPGRLVARLYDRRWLFIVALVIGATALAAFATRVRIDNSLQVWFVEGDPALVAYDDFKATFGNDETIIVAATDPEGTYTVEALERIRRASERIQALPRVRRVSSLSLGLYAEGDAISIEVGPLLGSDPVTAQDAALVRARVEADPSFRGTIVGDTDTISLILVEPKTLDDFDRLRPEILAEIGTIVDAELRTGDGGAHLGGIGVVYEGLNAATMRDTGVFVTLSYLVVLLGLWLLTRRLLWVLIGAAVVTVPIAATLGLAGALGRDMNMVTAVLPTLIMTIGVLDLVHLFDAYEDGRSERPDASPRRILVGSVAVVVVPCVVNSITDAIGFLALTSAPMRAIRDLGWLASVGLLFLLCSVLIIGIPALGRLGGRRGPPRTGPGFLTRVVDQLAGLARRRRLLILGFAVVLTSVAVVGITRINVDTYTIGFLADDDPVRRDHQAIEAQFGPYIPLEFTVTAPAGDEAGLRDPALMQRVERLERAFEGHPAIGRVTGVPEVAKRVNQLWFDGEPEAYAIPDDRRVLVNELEFYTHSADGRDNLEAMLDMSTWQITRVTARSGLPSAREIKGVLDDLGGTGAAVMGEAAEVRPAGYLPLYVRIIQHITRAQITSFAIVFVLVGLVMMMLLRSVKLGMVAMIPNVLPATMTLGLMGYAGIRLDVATVVIAAIAIGIAVNDTSHIMFRFKHELSRTPDDPGAAIERMMRAAGRPVVASSLILIAGFGVLLLASVKSIMLFGLLSAVTVGSALVADLLLTPALLLTVYRART
jgi:uncharacterized protein